MAIFLVMPAWAWFLAGAGVIFIGGGIALFSRNPLGLSHGLGGPNGLD